MVKYNDLYNNTLSTTLLFTAQIDEIYFRSLVNSFYLQHTLLIQLHKIYVQVYHVAMYVASCIDNSVIL